MSQAPTSPRRRILRAMVSTAVAVSALLCVTFLLLMPINSAYRQHLSYRSGSFAQDQHLAMYLTADHEGLLVRLDRARQLDPDYAPPSGFSFSVRQGQAPMPRVRVRELLLGIGGGSTSWTATASGTQLAQIRSDALLLPYWLVIVLAAIAPGLWLYPRVRRAIRREKGRCLDCGYDLRSTPQRCPECGGDPAYTARGPVAISPMALYRFGAGVAVAVGCLYLLNSFWNDPPPTNVAQRAPAPPGMAVQPQRFIELPPHYQLAEEEAVKFVPLDSGLERAEVRNRSSNGFHIFHLDGGYRHYTTPSTNGRPTDMRMVLETVLGLSRHDYDLPDELMDLSFAGDWVLRPKATQAEKMADLARIISDITGQSISFAQHELERDVLIASGTFKLANVPRPGSDGDAFVLAIGDSPDDQTRGVSAVSGGNFQWMLMLLGWHFEMPIIDQTETKPVLPKRLQWRTYASGQIAGLEGHERMERTQQLLQSLSQQTGLQFTIERRTQPVWLSNDALAARTARQH